MKQVGTVNIVGDKIKKMKKNCLTFGFKFVSLDFFVGVDILQNAILMKNHHQYLMSAMLLTD